MKLKAVVVVVGVGVLAVMGLFAAAVPAPGRIDGSAAREAFFSRLGKWMGGEAEQHGTVRLEGFFNMRLEAENVEIKGVQRPDALLRFKVGKLSARLNWLDAVMGRPDFNELILENVTAEASVPAAPEGGAYVMDGPLGIAGLAPLLETGRLGADGKPNPFARIQIHDARVAFASRWGGSGRRRAQPRLKIVDMQMKFGEEGRQEFAGSIVWRNQTFAVSARKGAPGEKLAGSSLDVFIGGKLFTLAASGELTSGPERERQFKGDMNVTSSDFDEAGRWLKVGWLQKIEPVNKLLSISGRVTWRKHEFSISGLEAELNGRSLSGALSVKDRNMEPGGGERPAVEGTLALSEFDLGALHGFALDENGADAASGLAGVLRTADADLRISVGRLSAGGVSGGSAALTLLAKDGRLSADMADMAVLGGRVRGHFALDASLPRRRLVVRATGADLDSAQLSQAFNAPGWLTGGANVNVEAQAEGGDWAGLLQSLNGDADVNFSEGGGVGLDLVGLAGGNGAAHRETQYGGKWNWTGRGFMRFDTLRAELAIDHGRIWSKSFELSTGGKTVAGRCAVDLPGQSIDWRFDVRPSAASLEAGGEAFASGEPASSVTIKGPWRNPSIRIGDPGAELDWPSGARTHLPGAAPNG